MFSIFQHAIGSKTRCCMFGQTHRTPLQKKHAISCSCFVFSPDGRTRPTASLVSCNPFTIHSNGSRRTSNAVLPSFPVNRSHQSEKSGCLLRPIASSCVAARAGKARKPGWERLEGHDKHYPGQNA